MKILNKIKKAAQQSKVFRYRTYKKINGVGHRELTDKIFFTTMFSLLTLGVLILFSGEKEKESPISPIQEEQDSLQPIEQEIVHSDLGDDPVVEETPGPSLTDLEQKVISKEASLSTYILKSGETFSTFLTKSSIAQTEHPKILETISTSTNLHF